MNSLTGCSIKTVFHCTLFVAETASSCLRHCSEPTIRALKHQNKTYRYIKESIARNESPSDAVVASVISMVIHEDHQLHKEQARMHLEALSKMIQLRGGMETLESNPTLLHKIFRTDVDFALRMGEQPMFWRHRLSKQLNQQCEKVNLARTCLIGDNALQQIVDDLMQTTVLLRNDPVRFKLHPLAYQELLISVSYRLLKLPVISESLDHAIQLGLMSVLTTLLFGKTSTESLHPLLQLQVKNLVLNPNENQKLDHGIKLWLLFAGGISVLDSKDRSWLIPQIRRCLADLGINNWPRTQVALRILPWFDALHDAPGYELYKAIPWHE
jgi:hypothetical protein